MSNNNNNNNNNSFNSIKCYCTTNTSCCCNNINGEIIDIEDSNNLINNSFKTRTRNNSLQTKRKKSLTLVNETKPYTLSEPITTKVTIEHNITNDRPLSHSLNTIANSLNYFTKAVEDTSSDNRLREHINKSTESIRIPMCTCHQSKTFPYCDSTHIKFNNETNSNLSPIYLTFKKNDNKQQIEEKDNNNNNVKDDNNNNVKDNNEDNIKEEEKVIIKPTNFKDKTNQNNIFNLEEIKKHNTIDSCWMIIHNKVYDITEYIPRHPGGKNALLRFAGRDGTENVQFHSAKMLTLLNNNYFIGHLQYDQRSVEPSKCLII